jgi:hypothetical protein
MYHENRFVNENLYLFDSTESIERMITKRWKLSSRSQTRKCRWDSKCKWPRAVKGGDFAIVYMGILLGDVMDQIIDWVYGQVVGFSGRLFLSNGQHGRGAFRYAVGAVYSPLFQTTLAGRSSLSASWYPHLKPHRLSERTRQRERVAAQRAQRISCRQSVYDGAVELFKLSVILQASLTSGITG